MVKYTICTWFIRTVCDAQEKLITQLNVFESMRTYIYVWEIIIHVTLCDPHCSAKANKMHSNTLNGKQTKHWEMSTPKRFCQFVDSKFFHLLSLCGRVKVSDEFRMLNECAVCKHNVVEFLWKSSDSWTFWKIEQMIVECECIFGLVWFGLLPVVDGDINYMCIFRGYLNGCSMDVCRIQMKFSVCDKVHRWFSCRCYVTKACTGCWLHWRSFDAIG